MCVHRTSSFPIHTHSHSTPHFFIYFPPIVRDRLIELLRTAHKVSEGQTVLTALITLGTSLNPTPTNTNMSWFKQAGKYRNRRSRASSKALATMVVTVELAEVAALRTDTGKVIGNSDLVNQSISTADRTQILDQSLLDNSQLKKKALRSQEQKKEQVLNRYLSAS